MTVINVPRSAIEMRRKKTNTTTHMKCTILQTDESYAEFFSFIESQIVEVKTSQVAAKRALFLTGMYDEDGKLKEEFK